MPLSDEDCLALLEELRLALQASEVERYNYFVNHSPDGRECVYAQKSLAVFRQRGQRQSLEDAIRRVCRALEQEPHD